MDKLGKILDSVSVIIENSDKDILTQINNISDIMEVDKKTAITLHFVNRDFSWNPQTLYMLEDIGDKLPIGGKKLELNSEKIKQNIQQQLLSGQLKELEAQASIIVAESKGGILQRNWRPMLMITFVGLIVAHWFGFTAPNIPESVQNSLLNIVLVGMGGYIVGRSGEKIMDKYKEKK